MAENRTRDNLRVALGLLLSSGVLFSGTVQAQSADACSDTCPPGQKIVASVDGERTSCYCSGEASGMQETVVDPSVANADLDPGQGQVTAPSQVQPDPQDAQNPDIQ